ncbi:Zinc finger RING-type [Penicillium cosmopolitanum]|uniref:Zinc finger RING-type n=1 Tax=Penicillium cosmopolitanum TaxID=1131564 RepID=A0A9X0B4F1_9EURO|nr:Zinc finger RING-type [Penicillium cosmopolitanum]KAJ5387784.1 Zinc finger RING-type [Penicillium cosmopolitanum]
MSTYEIEHNTTDPSAASSAPRRRRPDLSTFFSTLSEITPAPDHRPHAVPVPGDVSAAFYSLAEALEMMRRESGTAEPQTQTGDNTASAETSDDLLTTMIQNLLNGAEAPPREVEGVSEEFCDMLDRVPKSSLDSSQTCPICNNPFLEDEYPLVVRLPCHPTHLFDLECVRPWLRLRGTCPLDRFDFAKQQREKDEERKRIADEDEEEEWDGMYG